MRLRRMICVGAVAAGTLATTTGVANASTTSISEAGSSLAYPIVSVWAARYDGATVDTSSGGSGKGIAAVTAGQVDIGAVDTPLTPSQYTTGPGDYLQIPWALSATGVAYNLKGVGTGLKLTGKILAGIYNGTITTWSNSAITKINSASVDKALKKDGKITPVFRSDASGESAALQVFMEKSAPGQWKLGDSNYFGGKIGAGENGTGGVSAEIESSQGTIGYMSGAYLLQQHLSVAAIENAAGKYELPNISNILNAASSDTSLPPQGANFTGVSVVYPAKKYATAYPLATYTYAVVSKSDANAAAVKSFLSWVISPTGGQQYGVSLDFAPLPAGIRSADSAVLGAL